MDLYKLGSSSWTDNSLPVTNEPVTESFRKDIRDLNNTSSVKDFLHTSRVKSSRQFVQENKHDFTSRNQSSSFGELPTVNAKTNTIQLKHRKGKPERLAVPSVHRSYDFSDLHEVPPNRSDIERIQADFEERLNEILHAEDTSLEALDKGRVYQPYKDMIFSIKNKNLAKFNVTYDRLSEEPWLELLIKCDCLTSTCDEVTEKVVGMVGVISSDIGNILRKIRLTYQQSFQDLISSWEILRSNFKSTEHQLKIHYQKVLHLEEEIKVKEQRLNSQHEEDVNEMKKNFEQERVSFRNTINEQNVKIDQLSETLRSLNTLLRSMQSTATASGLITGNKDYIEDVKEKCKRLEFENYELNSRVIKTDKLAHDLSLTLDVVAEKEALIKHHEKEIALLKVQIKRRDEGIAGLVEKDLQRSTEFDRLQNQLSKKEKDLEETLLKDIATSVLCIRCKKSLDDVSNIRQASIEKEINNNPNHRLKCESYRLLLPNISSKKQPDRPLTWLRKCVRGILLSKMQHDVNISSLHGSTQRFPQYVYAWFERPIPSPSNIPNSTKFGQTELLQLLNLADEDRWAMYYACRAMARDNDPEFMIMWSLLDDFFNEEGSTFVSHCLSIILSVSGREVWEQFGNCAVKNHNVSMLMEATALAKVEASSQPQSRKGSKVNNPPPSIEKVNRNIWVRVDMAKEAAKLILTRALETHVNEVLDAIDAFTVIPTHNEDTAISSVHLNTTSEGNIEGSEVTLSVTQLSLMNALGKDRPINMNVPSYNRVRDPNTEKPSHIDLYLFIRLMLKQLQAEQLQRKAAVRLMFETASMGALSDPLKGGLSPSSASEITKDSTKEGHVEFPQFLSICHALFQGISTSEIANLYSACYYYSPTHIVNTNQTKSFNNTSQLSKRRVTADVFLEVADIRGLFSRYMRFIPLPVFAPHVLYNNEFTQFKPVIDLKKLEHEKELKAIESLLSAAASPTLSIHSNHSKSYRNTKSKGKHGQMSDEAVSVHDEWVSQFNELGLANETMLRGQLGALVHRKLVTLKPDLKILESALPEQWRTLLANSIADVESAIVNSYIKRPDLDVIDNINGYGPSKILRFQQYIDGFQPYVVYRRLLSLANYLKSLSDNPLLPPEVFTSYINPTTIPQQSVSSSSISISTTLPLSIGITRAEEILTSLEQSLLLGKYSHQELKDTNHFKMDLIRKKVYSRKILRIFRLFYHGNGHEVSVPANIRRYLRPGYLYGVPRAISIGARKERLIVRQREVHHEPWWISSIISEIILFKYIYDKKAKSIHLPCMPLSMAVVGYFYKKVGSMEVAERLVHDFMYGIAEYKSDVARIRLFSALLGEKNDDIDTLTSEVMSSPQAWTTYLTIIEYIREEVYLASHHNNSGPTISNILPPRQASFHKDMWAQNANTHLTKASFESSTLASNGYQSPYQTKTQRVCIENMLFVSSENSFGRADGKDMWSESEELLTRAVDRWAKHQKWLGQEHATLFIDNLQQIMHKPVGLDSQLTTPLPAQSHLIEVDDVLWLVMLQWSKLMAHLSSIGYSQAHFIDSNNKSEELSTIISNKKPSTIPQLISMMPQNSLESIFDAIYSSHDNSGNNPRQKSQAKGNTRVNITSDPHFYLTEYLTVVSNPKSIAVSDSRLSRLRKMLTTSVLWDVTTQMPKEADQHIYGAGPASSIDGLVYAVSPAHCTVIGKRLIESYWAGFKQFVNETEAMIKTIDDQSFELTTKLQHIRSLIEQAHVRKSIQEPPSGMVNDELTMISLAQDDSEMWTLINHLVRAIDELAMMLEIPFPPDVWRSGRRLFVERSLAFSAVTRDQLM